MVQIIDYYISYSSLRDIHEIISEFLYLTLNKTWRVGIVKDM